MPLYPLRLLLRFFCCTLLLALLSAPPVVAQPAAGSHVVSYKVLQASELELMLKQWVLDADGHMHYPLLPLPKLFTLEAAATSGTHNLYLLRKANADTVELLLTDSLGRVLRQPRQFMPRLRSQWAVLPAYVRPVLVGLPQGRGFVLTCPTGKAAHPALQLLCLGPDLAVRWQQQLVNEEFTSVKQLLVSDTHVWVSLTRMVSALTTQPQLWTCRLATGAVESNIAFPLAEEHETAVLVPDGLLVLGTTRRDHAPPLAADQPEPAGYRRDIARVLAPNGQETAARTLTWPTPGRPLHHWKAACVQPDGSYQLIGETYRDVVNGGTVALAVLGMGITGAGGFGVVPGSGYINQRPVGLVLARLGATGHLGQVQQLIVPEALHTSPADSGSVLPKGHAVDFRFRGFTAHQTHVVLNTTRQVLLYSMATGQLQPLMPARRATPAVLAIEPGHLTVGWSFVPGENLPEVEYVPLP